MEVTPTTALLSSASTSSTSRHLPVTPTNAVLSSATTSSTSRPLPVTNMSPIKQSTVLGSTTSAVTRHVVTKMYLQKSAKTHETAPRYDEKRRKITDVFVRAEWGSGPKEKKLPECLLSSGKMLARGNLSDLSVNVMPLLT